MTQRNIPEHGLHNTKVQWSLEAVGTVDSRTQCNTEEYRLLDTEGEGKMIP